MRLPQYNHVVETFPSDCADQSLRVRILLRRARGNGLVADTQGAQPLHEDRAICSVAIPNKVTRRTVPGKCLGDLARNPLCGRICRYPKRYPQSAPVAQNSLDYGRGLIGAVNLAGVLRSLFACGPKDIQGGRGCQRLRAKSNRCTRALLPSLQHSSSCRPDPCCPVAPKPEPCIITRAPGGITEGNTVVVEYPVILKVLCAGLVGCLLLPLGSLQEVWCACAGFLPLLGR
jgi:hypothetical protein